jgi:hypothetical protein
MAPKQMRQTPSQTVPNAARSGGFGFSEHICFGESPEQRSSDRSSAKMAGPFLPRPTELVCAAGRRRLRSSPERFLPDWSGESSSSIGSCREAGRPSVFGCTVELNTLGRGRHWVTARWRLPKRTASESSSRTSTRTMPPRKPARMSLRAICQVWLSSCRIESCRGKRPYLDARQLILGKADDKTARANLRPHIGELSKNAHHQMLVTQCVAKGGCALASSSISGIVSGSVVRTIIITTSTNTMAITI